MPGDPVDVALAGRHRRPLHLDRGRGRRPRPTPTQGHSLHVDADGLDPATEYHYRFLVGDFTSPVGRTRTLPADGRARRPVPPRRRQLPVVRVRHLRRLPPHGRGRPRPGASTSATTSTSTPRAPVGGRRRPSTRSRRSRTTDCGTRPTRSTPTSRPPTPRSRSSPPGTTTRWPTTTWATRSPAAGSPTAGCPERRAAAYRAWWENLPTRLPAPDSDHTDIYRDVVVGDLARITLLDERQYADVPPCRDVVDDDFGDCRRAGPATGPGWATPRRRSWPRPWPGRHDLEPGRQPGRAGRHRRRPRPSPSTTSTPGTATRTPSAG